MEKNIFKSFFLGLICEMDITVSPKCSTLPGTYKTLNLNTLVDVHELNSLNPKFSKFLFGMH